MKLEKFKWVAGRWWQWLLLIMLVGAILGGVARIVLAAKISELDIQPRTSTKPPSPALREMLENKRANADHWEPSQGYK